MGMNDEFESKDQPRMIKWFTINLFIIRDLQWIEKDPAWLSLEFLVTQYKIELGFQFCTTVLAFCIGLNSFLFDQAMMRYTQKLKCLVGHSNYAGGLILDTFWNAW